MALLEFYGTECKHCIEMAPLIERLEREEGVTVEKFEVWHNAENAKKFKEADKGRCGGVPFFLNTETDDFICGAAPYERVLEWAGIKK